MANALYPWKRFWLPSGVNPWLEQGAFLHDPEGHLGRHLRQGAVSLDQLTDAHFLALLGEPGIGKSTTVKTDVDALRKGLAPSGARVLLVQLRTCDSINEVRRQVFELEEFLAWNRGEYDLHLFLDSVDEAHLLVKNLPAYLAEELKKYDKTRLFLRLVCRKFEWPDLLRQELQDWWGNIDTPVYELAPLRLADVRMAAEHEGIPPEVFLAAVRMRGAHPLAARPQTLRPLLKRYRQDGVLGEQAELYEWACLQLSREENPYRPIGGETGKLDDHRRLAVARHIAGMTVFSSRSPIWISRSQKPPGQSVSIAELREGAEVGGDDSIGFPEGAIQETLGTALFTGDGEFQLTWSTRPYAEFLAAEYVVERDLPIAQVKSLLVNPTDPEKGLAPQLQEVAAWLASRRQDVWDWVLASEPEALLGSNVVTGDWKQRAALAMAILDRFRQGSTSLVHLADADRLLKLEHPDLHEQLQPLINDPEEVEVARLAAVRIAEVCHVAALQHDLADLALNPVVSVRLRADAAQAVSEIAEIDTRQRLRPLARTDREVDPQDELKGSALQALWPDCIAFEELTSLLEPPQREFQFLAYEGFLAHDLPRKLPVEDLPQALKWLAEQHQGRRLASHLDNLSQALIERALNEIDKPGVLPALGQLVARRLRWNRRLLRRSLTGDDEFPIDSVGRRHQLVLGVAQVWVGERLDLLCLACGQPPLVRPQDLTWILVELREASDDLTWNFWSRLVQLVWRPGIPEHRQELAAAAELDPRSREWLLGLVQSAGAPPDRESPAVDEPKGAGADLGVDKLLSRCEAGELTVWPTLVRQAAQQSDLLTLAAGVDTKTLGRLSECARQYLLAEEPSTSLWLAENYFPWKIMAAYQALLLLTRFARVTVETLPPGVWAKWAAAVVRCGIGAFGNTEDTRVALSRLTYERAPVEWMEAFSTLVDSEDERGEEPTTAYRAESCWDAQIEAFLLERVRSEKLRPASTELLLTLLLQQGSTGAESYATALLSKRDVAMQDTASQLPSDHAARVLAAASALLHAGSPSAWPTLLAAMKNEPTFGRRAVIRALSRWGLRSQSLAVRVHSREVAELYVWLAREFPEPRGAASADEAKERERVADWMRELLMRLKERGTWEAVEALDSIQQRLPDRTWLVHTRTEARAITRYKTWPPTPVAELRQLFTGRARRLVRNGDELLELVVESLARLEMKLTSDTRAAIDLWNEVSAGVLVKMQELTDGMEGAAECSPEVAKSAADNASGIEEGTDPAGQSSKVTQQPKRFYFPKDENRLSDYVKRHLEEDLKKYHISVNREPEVSRGRELDIKIETFRRGSQQSKEDLITLVIEVKGCWHRELGSAMKTQLVDRYLNESKVDHGIFLVGWFRCEAWSRSGDYRYRATRAATLEQVREELDGNASALSRDDITVRACVLDIRLRDEEILTTQERTARQSKASKPKRRSAGSKKKVTSTADTPSVSDQGTPSP